MKIYVGMLRCVVTEVSIDFSVLIFLVMCLRPFLDVTMQIQKYGIQNLLHLLLSHLVGKC